MIAFIILKLTNLIGLSWWWIFASPVVSAFPMGLTIAFILFQHFGLFTTDVSWWWIILPITIDLGELGGEKKCFTVKSEKRNDE